MLATPIWIRVARRLHLLDAPNPIVPQHRAPTAHMGGLPVALAAYGALAIQSLWPGAGSPTELASGVGLTVVLGGMAFLMLGALDDLLRLSARSKFAAQLFIAIWAAIGGVRPHLAGVPLLDGAIAVLCIVTVVNAVNLTDVCDGLVAGLAAATLLTAAASQTTLAPLCLAAAGACLGFLVFNAPPARVFLGDAGSHWLGFLVVAAALSAVPTRPTLDAVRIALWCGVFLFELSLLVLARTARGIPFWLGSPDHFSLRLQAVGLPRWATVAIAWAVGGVLGVLAWRVPELPSPWSFALPAAAFLLGVVLLAVLWLTTGPPRPQEAAGEPRRLLWFHQNFVSSRQPGNARAIHLVSALLERGWVVDVVTTQASDPEQGESAKDGAPLVEREGRLAIHRLPLGGGPQRRIGSGFWFCARALLYAGRFRRVDVLFASTPPLLQALVAAVVVWARRAPLVLEVRDLWPLSVERLGLLRSPLGILLAEWMEAFTYRAARHVIAVSPAFESYLEDMGVASQRITVAPTGIESIALSEADRARERAVRGWEQRFVVVYAGSFDESYEIGRLLRAAERSATLDPRILWLLVGGGRARGEVEAAAARGAGVTYVGLIERDGIWPLLQGSDLGIVSLGPHPVLDLVVPGKLFDYAAAALPILSTTAGMTGAIVLAAGAGRVVPGASAEALADEAVAIAKLSESERRDIGSAGREWLLAHMPNSGSARSIALEIEEVAREAAGRSQAARLLFAATGAFSDVLSRRASRAASHLLSPDRSRRCEDQLRDWLARAEGDRGALVTPLRIPTILTTQGTSPAQ